LEVDVAGLSDILPPPHHLGLSSPARPDLAA
jgi:hypothetical protein